MLSALILAEALILEGRQVAQSQSFEPLSRGGVSRSDLVVRSQAIDYPLVTELDILLILDQIAVEESQGMIKKGGLVLTDPWKVPAPPEGEFRHVPIALAEKAAALGNARVANIVALGAIAGLSGLDGLGGLEGLCGMDSLQTAVRENVPAAFADLNIQALRIGFEEVRESRA